MTQIMPQQSLAEKLFEHILEVVIETKTEKTPSPWAGLFESHAVSRFSLEEQALPDKNLLHTTPFGHPCRWQTLELVRFFERLPRQDASLKNNALRAQKKSTMRLIVNSGSSSRVIGMKQRPCVWSTMAITQIVLERIVIPVY